MLFERARTNWWIVVAGAVAGIGTVTVPSFDDQFSAGVGAVTGLAFFIFLVLLIIQENQWAGLMLAGMMALKINYPDGYEDYAITVLATGVFVGVWLIAKITPKYWRGAHGNFSGQNHILLILYFVMGYASLFFQRFHNDAIWPILNEMVIAIGIFAWLIRHKRQKLLALEWMVVFSCGLWVVLVYSLFFSSHGGKGAPIPFFENANYFSAALSIGLPFMIWIGWSRRDWLRWLGWGIAGSFLFGIIWFQSRGAWVGLAGGTVFFVWYLSQNTRQRLAIAGFLVVGMVTLIYWTFDSERQNDALRKESGVEQLKSIVDTEYNFSNRERIIRWKMAFRLFEDSPLLGIQAGRFDKRFKFKLESMEEVEQISYWYGWNGGAHSEYLTRLAERGLPATLMFIGYFVWIMVVLFRLVKYEILGRVYGACIAFALGTWIVHGFFNDLTTENAIWLPLMLMTGYIIQMKPKRWPEIQDSPSEMNPPK